MLRSASDLTDNVSKLDAVNIRVMTTARICRDSEEKSVDDCNGDMRSDVKTQGATNFMAALRR